MSVHLACDLVYTTQGHIKPLNVSEETVAAAAAAECPGVRVYCNDMHPAQAYEDVLLIPKVLHV